MEILVEEHSVHCNKPLRLLAAYFTIMLSTAVLAQAQVQDDDVIGPTQMAGSHLRFTHVGPPTAKNGMAHARFGIPNIDSVPNFNGQFFAPGQDPNGNPENHWYFNMLGNPPQMGGTTTLDAPIVPVSLDLRNADGSPRFVKVVNGIVVTCATPPRAKLPSALLRRNAVYPADPRVAGFFQRKLHQQQRSHTICGRRWARRILRSCQAGLAYLAGP
jgi:hypothetical protein